MRLSKILRRMLGEAAAAEFQDGGNGLVNADVLASVVMREALRGRQWAIELVLDRAEGKAVRAAQENLHETEVEDALDRISAAHLNRLGGLG